eukprot:s3859_g1.t1
MLDCQKVSARFGVNHLGHFLLANLLIDKLAASGTERDPSRVIALSSSAHQIPSKLLKGDLGDLQSDEYTPWGAYGQSKLANLLFAYELDRRCRAKGLSVVSNALHPGVVNTELFRYAGPSPDPLGLIPVENLTKPLLRYVLKTPEDGAKTSVLLATQSEGKLSGQAAEPADGGESRATWAGLSLDATPPCPGTEPEAAPAAEEEETDPALQSLVPEEAAFGASANPPSPVQQDRFDALSLLGPVKVEEDEVTFEAIAAELEGDTGVAASELPEPAASLEEH